MAGKNAFTSFPEAKQALAGKYVETRGSMPEAARDPESMLVVRQTSVLGGYAALARSAVVVASEHFTRARCAAWVEGVYRAAHAYLALRLIGYPRLRNYVGSWKEWGDRLDLPIEHPREP